MKKTLLALAAVAVLAVSAGAQTKVPPTMPKMPVKKTMPMRDPKTGRFMKKPATMPPSKMHTKGTMKKTMPMRDPKTGKFMKKKG